MKLVAIFILVLKVMLVIFIINVVIRLVCLLVRLGINYMVARGERKTMEGAQAQGDPITIR